MATVRYRDVTINLPADWGSGTRLLVLAPPGSDFDRNLLLAVEESPATTALDKIAAQRIEEHKLALTAFNLLASRPQRVGQLDGHLIEFGYLQAGAPLVQRALLVKKGQQLFTLSYTDLAANIEQARVVSNKVFATTTF